jgi:hypothetical protein
VPFSEPTEQFFHPRVAEASRVFIHGTEKRAFNFEEQAGESGSRGEDRTPALGFMRASSPSDSKENKPVILNTFLKRQLPNG